MLPPEWLYKSCRGAAPTRLATLLGGLLERPNGEAKRGLMSLKNSRTASASILRPSGSAPIDAPESASAMRAASAQKATRERSLEGVPARTLLVCSPRLATLGPLCTGEPENRKGGAGDL